MNLVLDDSSVRQIAQTVVEEALAALAKAPDDQRVAYLEAEAATLLGIGANSLRDARLRGEITATKLGGRIGYERSELLAYLSRGRMDGTVGSAVKRFS